MPDKFHQMQYLMAGVLAVICMFAYLFAPVTKSETLASLLSILVGFIVGKFSNGFKRPGGSD